MTPAVELRQLASLVVENRAHEDARSLEVALRAIGRTPYRFEPSDLVHAPWGAARRRGYAACGEAAALLGAAALNEGRRVALEVVTGSPVACGVGYRHAIAVVEGVPLDPYARHACSSPRVVLASLSLRRDGALVEVY